MNDEKRKINSQARMVYGLLRTTENIINDTSETDENFKARINEIKEKIKVLLDELDARADSL